MPPLPVIANVYRCALEWSNGSQHAVNVMHFRDDAGGQTAAALATALDGVVNSAMWYFTADAFSVKNLHITKLDGVTPSVDITPATPANWDGGLGGQWIPQSAYLAKFTTSVRGRSHRGRVYLPFVSEGGQSGGLLDASAVPTWQDEWDDFIPDLAATNWSLVVASYKLGTAGTVQSIKCEGETATMRRRQTRNR